MAKPTPSTKLYRGETKQDAAWDFAKQSVPKEVLQNIGVAPDVNPSQYFFRPKKDYCHTCHLSQPIKLNCAKCEMPRYFKCFENKCFNRDHWNDFVCRYCKPCNIFSVPTPPLEERASNVAWLSYQKAYLFYRKLEIYTSDIKWNPPTTEYPQSVSSVVVCYHCNKQETEEDKGVWDRYSGPFPLPVYIYSKEMMDVSWFCDDCKTKKCITDENIENYCYLCRSPMPITQNCKSCGNIYMYFCCYPSKCITTEFPRQIGTDRWYNCAKCLNKKLLALQAQAENLSTTPQGGWRLPFFN